MYGALIASIINGEYKDDSYLNVETIMTVAVAEALLRVEELKEENKHVLFTCDPVPQWMKEEINNSICKWSDEFHMDPQTLRSSSGIALVASAGWLASSVEEARRMAKLIMRYKQPKTDVQSYFLPLQCQDPNNTPVSAEILASIIFFARNNIENEYIKSYILQEINCAYPDAYLLLSKRRIASKKVSFLLLKILLNLWRQNPLVRQIIYLYSIISAEPLPLGKWSIKIFEGDQL